MRYNYFAILAAWLVKLAIHPSAAPDVATVIDRMAVGPLPAPVMLTFVALFYGACFALALWAGHTRTIVDEVHGLEEEMEHWKT